MESVNPEGADKFLQVDPVAEKEMRKILAFLDWAYEGRLAEALDVGPAPQMGCTIVQAAKKLIAHLAR